MLKLRYARVVERKPLLIDIIPVREQDIAICVSVCMSVCLFVRIACPDFTEFSVYTHDRSSINPSLNGGLQLIAMLYALPVLWMTRHLCMSQVSA